MRFSCQECQWGKYYYVEETAYCNHPDFEENGDPFSRGMNEVFYFNHGTHPNCPYRHIFKL